MPSLFIITGSNGAGKSTVGYTYLPPEIQKQYPVFDGDKLTMQKKWELRTSVPSDKEARKIADAWVSKEFADKIKKAIDNHDHFAYEGHFRDISPLGVPRRFKRKGYYLSLIFMGLTSTKMSELRVINRARYSGHNVSLPEIHANFYGNLDMLNKYYKLFDEIIVADTSSTSEPSVLLHLRNKQIISSVSVEHLPKWFANYLPNLCRLLKNK